MICKKCGKEFFEDWRKYPKGEARFCSKACSNSRNWSEKDKKIKPKKRQDPNKNVSFLCLNIIKNFSRNLGKKQDVNRDYLRFQTWREGAVEEGREKLPSNFSRVRLAFIR